MHICMLLLFLVLIKLFHSSFRNSTDLCAYDWLVDHHYSSQTIGMVNVVVGQTWGCSLKVLGVHEAAREENGWGYGSGNFRLVPK